MDDSFEGISFINHKERLGTIITFLAYFYILYIFAAATKGHCALLTLHSRDEDVESSININSEPVISNQIRIYVSDRMKLASLS